MAHAKQTKRTQDEETKRALDAMARIRAGSRKGAATTKAMIAFAKANMPSVKHA